MRKNQRISFLMAEPKQILWKTMAIEKESFLANTGIT